jgi:hypothetical protein
MPFDIAQMAPGRRRTISQTIAIDAISRFTTTPELRAPATRAPIQTPVELKDRLDPSIAGVASGCVNAAR